MVFADISGFTALSERLATYGRVGAEEITELLQHVFTHLLAVVYENDGSLLKFGGDALLLLFLGQGHQRRAAHAADGMRRKLDELGELESLAGGVRLDMTVGAHSGRFDLFLVGDSHRELLVAGPATSRVVELEGAARRGEVMISRELADHLEAEVVTPARGGLLLSSTPRLERVPAVVVPPTTGSERIAPLLPTAVRRFLEAGGAGAEHRQAVVAFVAFEGTDALIRQSGAGACADALHELVCRAASACEEHDITFLGSDVAAGGGKLILTAGAPVGHDDDAERLLRAVRAIAGTPAPLDLRVGVNHGPLFAGVVGPPYRLTYTVMGDTVNLAARLAYQGEPGQVVTTTDILQSTPSRFTTTALPPLRVKGKSAPIDAVVLGAPGGQRIEQTHRLPLAGRDRELARLEAHLDATPRGGRVAELVGPPGIGKSRLLSELRARHPERRLYYGSCSSYESSTPYYAFRGLLRFVLELPDDAGPAQLIRRLRATAPELVPWASLVGIVVDIDVPPGPDVEVLEPEFRPARLHQVVGELLTRLLPQTSIVRLEDVHWIDDASRALLRHVARAVVPATTWLVVVTSREAVFTEVVDEVIELAPLDEQAVQEFTHAAAARGLVTLDVAQALADRAAGNPLFLQELLAFAGDVDEVPDSVERVIAARLDHLEPRHRALLRQAALIGDRFDLSLLRAVTGEPVPDTDLDVLETFVRREGPSDYVFEHALYREVAYAGLPYRDRRELHDRAARVIETRHLGRTDDVAEILALHYHRADRHDRSWHYNRVAAERARSRYALADAVRFLRWALSSSTRATDTDPAAVTRAWEELGDLLERLGNYSAAADAYRRARRRADPEHLPELWYRSGIVREREGRYNQAMRWYGRARRELAVDPERDPTLWLRVRLRLVEVRIRQGRDAEAQKAIARLLPEVEAHGDTELTARAHFVAGWALRRGPDAEGHRRRALSLYQDLGDLGGQGLVHTELGVGAYYQGAWATAIEHYTQAATLHDRVGDTISAAVSRSNVGEIRSDQGRSAEAEEALQRAASVFDAAGYAIASGFARINLGRLAARQGRYDRAEALLDEALATYRRISAQDYEVETRLRMAELAVFRGEPARALELLADAERHVASGSPTASFRLRLRGVALRQRGDHEPGITDLRHAREVAEESNDIYERALADVALAGALDDSGRRERGDAALAQLGVIVPPEQLVLGPGYPSAENTNHA